MLGGNNDDVRKYDKLDFDRFRDKQEALLGGGAGGGGGERGGNEGTGAYIRPPVSSSWLKLYVQLPSRLAATTIFCILIYEILVGVAMGARKLRYVMVNWLMWLLLAVNGVLLLSLGLLVYRSKKDISLGIITKALSRKTRVEETEEV